MVRKQSKQSLFSSGGSLGEIMKPKADTLWAAANVKKPPDRLLTSGHTLSINKLVHISK